jgi:Coenzyme PQQ synthesis protein D (PqqD)
MEEGGSTRGETFRVSEEITGPARFELSGHVLHDAIDGEVIAIDLSSGTYYSLRGSAAEVWGMIKGSPGASNNEIAEALAVRYQLSGHEVDASVAQFLGQLHGEGLVTVVAAAGAAPPVALTVEPTRSPREFVAPVLDKYTDMQDLVLIDPVHDVTGAGWPHAQPGAATGGSGT